MIQSVERAVRILQCFDTQQQLGITQISKKMNLTKSTTFGLVSTLVEMGLLEQDIATSQYRLGMELFRLGNRVDADGRQLVSRELASLCEKLEETVNYMRPDSSNIIYLVKHESPHSMRICTTIGQRLPMYCTAGGKAILAYLPQEECDRIIASFQFFAFTENTITNPGLLYKELSGVRKNGYGLDCEELEIGLTCVGVPVLDSSGRPVAAISCSGPTSRMTDEKIRQCCSELRVCAERLSKF